MPAHALQARASRLAQGREVLDDGEARDLAAANDQASRALLVASVWRLCLAVARRWTRPGLEREELASVGAEALLRTVDQWNPDLGALALWATPRIGWAIRRHVARCRSLVSTDAERAAAARRQVEREGDHAPVEIRRRAARMAGDRSLDVQLGEDGATYLEQLEDEETPAPDVVLEAFEVRGAVRSALAQLPARERQVLELRSEGQTHEEIGARLGLHPTTVQLAERRGEERIQRKLLHDLGARS